MSLPSRLLARNWTLKISALGLALLLWISVRVETPDRHELPDIPVRVELNDPEWLMAGEPLPTTVSVRFSGPSRELIRMAMDRPNVVIPVDLVHREDTTVILRSQWVRVQDRPGVTVDDIQPSSVRLAFEAIERVSVPILVRATGTLPSGLAMAGSPEAHPAEVRLTGRASRVEEVDSVPLEVVDLAEVHSSDFQVIPVDTTGLSELQLTPTVVSVRFPVETEVERVVSGIPVVLTPEREDVEVSPSTLTVTVMGARSLVEGLDPTTLRLVAGVDDVTLEDDEEEEVSVTLEGLPDLVRGSPSQSTVTVRPVEAG